jgi:hypothetical protein
VFVGRRVLCSVFVAARRCVQRSSPRALFVLCSSAAAFCVLCSSPRGVLCPVFADRAAFCVLCSVFVGRAAFCGLC